MTKDEWRKNLECRKRNCFLILPIVDYECPLPKESVILIFVRQLTFGVLSSFVIGNSSLRKPVIHHCTSQPIHFFGREKELALLDQALAGNNPSVVAMVGPGGQGKTAIAQHWLEQIGVSRPVAGIFLWSFYRSKDSDLCLRELYAYAEGLSGAAEVSASYCVDHLLAVLRRERWAVAFDGTEVVQHDTGQWFGRFVHPEMGRLVEELASAPMPGVIVLTSRFPFPTLTHRLSARIISLGALDKDSACGLLGSFGVTGDDRDLVDAAASCGFHAKAVELLGTFLVRFKVGKASAWRELPDPLPAPRASDEEVHVARMLTAYQNVLPQEAQDILALANAFRQPPSQDRLLEYLASQPVQTVLHKTWARNYLPFRQRPAGGLAAQIQDLVDLRLLERVGIPGAEAVIDAHPLVRRGFENVLGPAGKEHSGQARAGFLRGRPDRRPPSSLTEAREEVELFHAYCDAGLWNEADGVYVALDNPKHRFLAPAFERDLSLSFFPEQDWRREPLWAGFGRYRSLAICLELLGQFEDALNVYRPADAPLRGDALIALGRLRPLLDQPTVPHPWQALWQAYRAHALCLAGRTEEAIALAKSLVPVDVYEWVHVFECLLRAGKLDTLDLNSVLYRPPMAHEHQWSSLARRRMHADYLRLSGQSSTIDLEAEYRELVEAYDRSGLPYERSLTRLGYARWLLAKEWIAEAKAVNAITLELARRHGMGIVLVDALELIGANPVEATRKRQELGFAGPTRP